MSRAAISRARRRSAVTLRAYDWTLDPSAWDAGQIALDFDAVRYDDILRPALRVRATLVVDDDGDPVGLTDMIADRRLT